MVRDYEDVVEALVSVVILLHWDHDVKDFLSENVLFHHWKLPLERNLSDKSDEFIDWLVEIRDMFDRYNPICIEALGGVERASVVNFWRLIYFIEYKILLFKCIEFLTLITWCQHYKYFKIKLQYEIACIRI